MRKSNTGSQHGGSGSTSTGRILAVAMIAWGLLVAALVAADGSPGWQILRAVLVLAATAVGLLILTRLPRVGSILALIFGAIGLTVGIVFGLRYLMVDGLTWQSIVGLVTLAISIILLILGIRTLVSGIGRGWQFAAVPVLIIVVAILAWIITPAVLATNVPQISHGETTPQDFGLTAQEVHFTTTDGVELEAWYIPSANRAAVVLRHGSGSTRTDTLAQAAVLAKHGYGVLITDARGHGGSCGRAMDFGWYGNEDISAAVSFLIKQPSIDSQKIAVAGLSMGGEEAIGAMAADPRIAAVVAEGATGRTDADKAWLSETYGVRGRIQQGIEWAEYSITDILTEASKPMPLAEAVKKAASRPVLLIAGGKVEDEQQSATYLQKQSPASVTVWTVPDAGHTGGLATAPAEWETRVISFLDKALIE